MLVPDILDERLLPHPLRLVLRKLTVELPMRFSTNVLVNGRPVSFALIGIIEPEPCQLRHKRAGVRYVHVLEPSILVSRRRTLDNVCCRRLPDAQVHHWGDDGRVQDVSRVDECSSCRVGELLKACCRLLCRHEGTGCVDVQVAREVGQWQREWIFRIVWSGRAGLKNVSRKSISKYPRHSYRCRRQRWEDPIMISLSRIPR